MKEKMIEKLIHTCGLGEILADAEAVSGGLMHNGNW